MNISLPEDVKYIIDSLEKRGFEAYAVGGCVRDMMLGIKPKDYDITTSAAPGEIKEVFRHTVDTGIEHGTVTVLYHHKAYEVTTYRIDGEYKDSRHPSQVTFSKNLTEDLKRRDFTINAMAFNERHGLIDIFGGMDDLKNKRVKCVGDPDERFSEDALRVLRAVRFAAQLGFKIEKRTEEAIRSHRENLRKISAERIREELIKLLVSDNPGKVRDLYEYGLTAIFLPELDECFKTSQKSSYHIYNVGEHIVRTVESIEAKLVLRVTMLLHDIGKPLVHYADEHGDHFKGHQKAGAERARKIMRRLKFDNDTIRKVTTLIFYHDYRPRPEDAEVRLAIYKIGGELFEDYIKVQRADAAGKRQMENDPDLKRLCEVEKIFYKVRDRGDCVSLSGLAISGRELMEAGILPGRQMGELLNKALMLVLKDRNKNNKEELINYCLREASGRT